MARPGESASALTHALAIELGPHGVRVNAVAPGLVTDEPLRLGEREVHPYVEMMIQATPMRRTGVADDIAGAVLFLASAESPWTTGAVLEVSGGSHCGRPHVPLSRELR
jgi:NAD(P)-dependent dehydrogenase (short-subunit alcohol dehydrogenase family)